MKNFGGISQDTYYDKLIVLRNNEMNQFWKRSVYLSAIQGVIISFFIQSITDPEASNCLPYLFITAVLGCLLAIACSLLINTNRLWFDYYERKITEFEKQINTGKNIGCGGETFKFGVFYDDDRDKIKHEKYYVSTKKMCLAISIIFAIYWFVMLIVIIIFMIVNNINYILDFLSVLPQFTAILHQHLI